MTAEKKTENKLIQNEKKTIENSSPPSSIGIYLTLFTDAVIPEKLKKYITCNAILINKNNLLLKSSHHIRVNNKCIYKVVHVDSNSGLPVESFYLNKLQREECELPFEMDNITSNNNNLKFLLKPIVNLSIYPSIKHLTVEVSNLSTTKKHNISEEFVESEIYKILNNQILNFHQRIAIYGNNQQSIVQIKINDIIFFNCHHPENNFLFGILTLDTEINLFPSSTSIIGWKPKTTSLQLSSNFNMDGLKIGGLKDQFITILRRVFMSRMAPTKIVKEMGVKHVKGLLLFGPPGTGKFSKCKCFLFFVLFFSYFYLFLIGKTAIARQLHEMLDLPKDKFKIINGPELLSSYIGETEKKVRQVFQDATHEWNEKGEKSDLHLIVFDEIDALAKKRGLDGGSVSGNVNSNVMATLLTIFDGFDSPQNFIVVGTTNRRDMIDPALLRPGRMEVQLEISLPDERGRQEILKIHTSEMSKHDRLSPDVDFEQLSILTKNYSGAELEGLVKSASSLSIAEGFKLLSSTSQSQSQAQGQDAYGAARTNGILEVKREIDGTIKPIKVSMNHFEKAMNDIIPAFGSKEIGFSDDDMTLTELKQELISWSDDCDILLNDLSNHLNQFKMNTTSQLIMTTLLHGDQGSGRTTISKFIALSGQFPFIKNLTAQAMAHLSSNAKIQRVIDTFEDSYKSPSSIIILDGIERLIDYIPLGHRFNVEMVNILSTYLIKSPPENCKLMILTTCNTTTLPLLENLALTFQSTFSLPNVNLTNYNIEPWKKIFNACDFKSKNIDSDLMKILTLHLSWNKNYEDYKPFSIKQWLFIIESLKQRSTISESLSDVILMSIFKPLLKKKYNILK